MHRLADHVAVHGLLGDLRALAPERIIGDVERSGLRGHGGAAFPTARKMRAVAARRKPKSLVVNATEGEPASKKDRALLREVPHLVLDGAAAAARAVGAAEAHIAISEADTRGRHAIAEALEERRGAGLHRSEPSWNLVPTPERYLAGQETALISFLNGGPGLPTFGHRPFERGVRGRPTLVQNAETLAHIGLITRHGGDWFRGLGTAAHPGSALVTVSGAVSAPGVYEIAHGMAVAELMEWVGAEQPQAMLIGGYFGTWVPAAELQSVRLSGDGLRPFGAALGAGVLVALPREACPVAETARVAAWFASESAGQCGPCVNGLAAISHTVREIATGVAGRRAFADLERWTRELPGRGACQHPDGAVRFVASALRVFAAEYHDHARHGRCERCLGPAVLPVLGRAGVVGPGRRLGHAASPRRSVTGEGDVGIAVRERVQ
jgi:NADH:ubiquinone oxidoreductase subunit F (NADH-binding)